MPRKPASRTPARRSRASSGEITEDAYYEEIADLLRTMPSDWRRQYRSGRDKLAAIGGPMLPDTPSPEQAMLLIGITAGGNPSGDTPFGPHRVPRAVREAAMKGIRLSHANNYGAWDFIGLARAIELVIVPSVSDTTFKRMGLYLFRHKKDALGSGFGNDAKPSRGYMAWLNWGGDPAVPWTRAFERNPRRNPDLDLPPPPPDEGFWAGDAALAGGTVTEAITAPALTVKRSGRLPSKALAIYRDDGHRFKIVLIDPKVLRRGEVVPRDVLGYVTAYYWSGEDLAKVDEAASEPGYGYLLYALMANYVGRAGAKGLMGSNAQTKYAKKFWEKQPQRVLQPLSAKEFRQQFGITARDAERGGDMLVKSLAGAGAPDHDIRLAQNNLLNLGSYYFGRYYGVASGASRLPLEEVKRPVSPRAGAAAISRVRASLRNLALVKTGGDAYLLTVPRGATELGVGNMLTRIVSDAYATRTAPVYRYRALPFYRDVEYILANLRAPRNLPPSERRILQRMEERGQKVKEALAAAGIPEERQDDFLDHLLTASEAYYPLTRPEPHEVMALISNPRRFPSSVRIFMPV